MKWLIIMLVVLMPVIGYGEEEGMPGDPSASGAPEFEQQSDPSAQEPVMEGEPAKSADTAGKALSPQSDKNVNSGVRFQTIEDLNKLAK